MSWAQNFGAIGFPIAHLIVSIFYLLVLIKARSLLKIDIFKQVIPFLFSALIMGMIVSILNKFLVIDALSSAIILVLTGATAYFLFTRYIFGINILQKLKEFYKK